MSDVLIIDDNLDVLESTAALLESMGHSVETETQASNALRAIDVCRPAVVLLDLHMPGLDVRTLVRSVRRADAIQATPIVLFSADSTVRDLAPLWGADGCLVKPFQFEELERLLARHVARHATA